MRSEETVDERDDLRAACQDEMILESEPHMRLSLVTIFVRHFGVPSNVKVLECTRHASIVCLDLLPSDEQFRSNNWSETHPLVAIPAKGARVALV